MNAPPATAVPELLSPAADWDAMRAAVSNGADAVYFGLSQFNARHRARNFTLEELPEVMAYLHGHNVRGYVTFNTLIFSDELPEAVRFISAVAGAGVDAVIVQDLGLASLIHRLCPALAIHGSTQMTLTEPRGIDFVHDLGVERVILARELSAADIRRITAATRVPVEVFIHGALCVSYSGQCLTSESIGGRSANRGQRAQACRLPYDLIVDGKAKDLGDKSYVLSPQDLAAYDLVADLAAIGVCSFKIEGRLKSAHYVAATTQTYRSAIDAITDDQPFALPLDRQRELAQSFSRGFTHGYFDGVDHQELVHARFPKSRGLRAGTVIAISPRTVLIEASTDLKPGDGLVFDDGHPDQDEQGGRVLAVVPPVVSAAERKAHAAPMRLELAFAPESLNLSAISIGATVWKADDPAVRKKLEQSYARERVVRRGPIRFKITAIPNGSLTLTPQPTPAAPAPPGPAPSPPPIDSPSPRSCCAINSAASATRPSSSPPSTPGTCRTSWSPRASPTTSADKWWPNSSPSGSLTTRSKIPTLSKRLGVRSLHCRSHRRRHCFTRWSALPSNSKPPSPGAVPPAWA